MGMRMQLCNYAYACTVHMHGYGIYRSMYGNKHPLHVIQYSAHAYGIDKLSVVIRQMSITIRLAEMLDSIDDGPLACRSASSRTLCIHD